MKRERLDQIIHEDQSKQNQASASSTAHVNGKQIPESTSSAPSISSKVKRKKPGAIQASPTVPSQREQHTRPLHVFLFNDLIILAREKKEKYNLVDMGSLNEFVTADVKRMDGMCMCGVANMIDAMTHIRVSCDRRSIYLSNSASWRQQIFIFSSQQRLQESLA